MATVRPPDTFNWEERNLKKAWSEWYREFQLYISIVRFVGTGADDAAKAADILKQKKSLLMYQIGRKGREIYDTFEFKNEEGASIEEDARTTDMINKKFEAYCEPTKTIVIDRVNFLRRDQQEGESFENYLLHLKTIAKGCDWDNAKNNDMIVLNIIKGIRNKILRDALLRENDLTLERCIQLCRATEQSQIHSSVIDMLQLQIR